jgi:hypothetical protein
VLDGMAVIMGIAALVALRGLSGGVQQETQAAAAAGRGGRLPGEDPSADFDRAER